MWLEYKMYKKLGQLFADCKGLNMNLTILIFQIYGTVFKVSYAHMSI